MTAARARVFLSYARVDRPRLAPLARALEAQGLEVWWDQLIEGGAAFAKSIEKALESCDAVVVAWSAAAVGSDWVLDEAMRGRDLRKLVPLSLDGTEPPLGYRQYQTVDFAHWRGDPNDAAVAMLLRGVRGVASRSTSVASEPLRTLALTQSRRFWLISGSAAALAGVAGTAAWRFGLIDRGTEPGGNSIAVLPFRNLSQVSEQDYFSDGLSEELRASLARNPRLRVMAQTSSGLFRDRKLDAAGIATRLGVAFLLDGSVRRAGDQVRINVDLIDGKTGFSRWSQTFDRALQDVFAVQSAIARTVVDALTATVGGSDAAAPIGGTTNLQAYDAYLRGRALYDLSADEASERAALAQFDAALAADPGYAAAHAARARSLTAIANQYGQVQQLKGLYDAAIAAAQQAIALAPLLAEGHSTLGYTLFQGRLDVRAAREPFERSHALGAGEATVLARFAQYCARTGRDAQAAQAMGSSLALDRLNPLIHRASASIEYAARRYAESIAPARTALEMNPRMTRAHAAIGDALLQLGRRKEARFEYLQEPVTEMRLAGLAIVERMLGNTAQARQAFDQLVTTHGDRVLYQQAQVLAQWSQPEPALDKLQQAREIGDSGLIYLRNDPMLDPLRRNPRFERLLASLGFD